MKAGIIGKEREEGREIERGVGERKWKEGDGGN